MHRTEHYLRQTKGSSIPKQILAVETESTLEAHPQLADVEIESLREWHCWRWVNDAGRITRCVQESGKDSKSFWNVVERQLFRGTCTWVFALPAARCSAILGLWDEIETGRLYLTERDYRAELPKDVRDMSGLRVEQYDSGNGSLLQSNCDMPHVRSTLQGEVAAIRPFDGNSRPRAVGYCVLEDPPFIVQCRRRGRAGSLKIVDLRNYGYSGGEAPTEARMRVSWIRDTVQAMCRILREHRLGSLQNTAGSQAFYTYKHRFIRHSIYVHCDSEALNLERESYYGGRSEAKRIGMAASRVTQLDFRGFYPAIGSTLAVPVRLVGIVHSPTETEIRGSMAENGVIAECRISAAVPAYPVRRRSEIIYPTGNFRTTLAGPELAYALECGHVQKIYRAALYEKAPAFAEYAREIHSLRCECERKGDRSGAEYLKRLGVSLYGKMAQTSARWVASTERYADHPYEAWWEPNAENGLERWRSLAWEVQREHKPKPGARPDDCDPRIEEWRSKVVQRETGESCPAIAAYITSAGRMLLWRAIRIAGNESVYYYDTDALFVDDVGLELLRRAGMVGDGEWGRLSIRAVYKSFQVLGIKHYVADGNTVCSGLPKGEVSAGPDRESYYLRAWLGRSINSGMKPTAERVKRLYERQSTYHHGIVGEDGWVRPLVM